MRMVPASMWEGGNREPREAAWIFRALDERGQMLGEKTYTCCWCGEKVGRGTTLMCCAETHFYSPEKYRIMLREN